MIIDLRSDTVTKPTTEMLSAMMKASVGDDVYKEDPTVNALEERIAEMFGKRKALFFPSGSMANQAAIKLHTNPGEQVICDKYAHIYNYEGGGASFNSGVSCKLIDGNRGMFTAQDVINNINPPDFYHSPLTSLVAIENTANKGGGACWDFNELQKIRKICDANTLGFHLDGARIWNALVAKKETTEQYGEIFDTISVCLSKGLGCPIGSVLVGDDAIMEGAMRIRKIFGGGMRQVGYFAAAGMYALSNNILRLEVDHYKAKELAYLLNKSSYVKKVEPVETNIVIFEVQEDINSSAFISKLDSKGVKLVGMGENKLRLVTHLDYSSTMHAYVLDLLSDF
ncbi:GntG family PLP-dependent aldolase [Oceanihabitans sp. 2_MG-2023]|uniref:threonine aldolase family protein n=1 Tax=Oceanihabitans sp. 2_MG-2023 TaxID=3062661 RepID=UPI0026E2739B|nr:GntG family PLP-dependent aldolase [Oceanihabitans sp. 2_MG-2023]MDO6596863.1 GntG family PLP-dependent aldolase [Oceanihabitans sp. 2_MG-2023]